MKICVKKQEKERKKRQKSTFIMLQVLLEIHSVNQQKIPLMFSNVYMRQEKGSKRTF